MKKKKKRRKKERVSTEPKKRQARQIELGIERVQRRILKEGKTDEVEDLLDKIERKIKDMKRRGLKRIVVNRLKSRLDGIK